MRSPNSLNDTLTPDYAYGPPNLSSYTSGGTTTGVIKPTLIGYPEGTQDGVMFRVLLDSAVKIWDVVQIAPGDSTHRGTAINSFQFQYGSTYQPQPNAQGVYIVAGIKHVGDTRGNGDDWYTEITAMTPKFFQTRRDAYLPSSTAAN